MNRILKESNLFVVSPATQLYLESYSALDLHALVRFGQWDTLLQIDIPDQPKIMFYRTAILYGARALAFAVKNDVEQARKEYNKFESMRAYREIDGRLLHNNSVADILAAESFMIKGEILYREKSYDLAFDALRQAVVLEDSFNYDEPWGRMQPVRHALGGLLLEQGHLDEAEEVYRCDLKYHPKNPWSLQGLSNCLQTKKSNLGAFLVECEVVRPKVTQSYVRTQIREVDGEFQYLKNLMKVQRDSVWADTEIRHSCSCVGLSI